MKITLALKYSRYLIANDKKKKARIQRVYLKIQNICYNTFKYHVFAPMGRFQLELVYLYFPPSSHLTVVSVM